MLSAPSPPVYTPFATPEVGPKLVLQKQNDCRWNYTPENREDKYTDDADSSAPAPAWEV
jgi:hypothetical protein